MKSTLKRWLERVADAFRELDYSEAGKQAYDNYLIARRQMEAEEAAQRAAFRKVVAMDLFAGNEHSVTLLGKRRYVTHVYDNGLTVDSRLYSVFGETPEQARKRARQLIDALGGEDLL